jgi:drug/metabolite transporter (DMT)-like permease
MQKARSVQDARGSGADNAVMAHAADEPSATRRRAWAAWAAICVIWGTTYLFIKIALATIPPFLMGGLRYVCAGAMLAGVLAARGRSLPPRAEWPGLAVLGGCIFLVGNGGIVWGEQHVPSGLAAVLVATVPFWMVTIDAVLTRGQALSARQRVGLAAGFAGIVLLVGPDITAARGPGFAHGVIALQISCVGFSIGSAYTRRRVASRDVLGAAALQMLFGGGFMLAAGTALGEWAALSFTAPTAWSLVYLTVVGSLAGFAAYSYALRHLGVAVASLYTYVNPVIAVALGTLLLGEPFAPRMAVAAGVIAAGIAAVAPARRAPAATLTPGRR